MSPRRRRAVELEQLWYGWSQENLDGSRGYGVVAASPGWKALLDSGNDLLGPAVTFPDVPGDRVPPPSGGFVHLRGTPVVFRRVALGSDDLARPGSYGVRVVFAPDAPLDGLTASRLLTSGVLDGPPPGRGERDLEPVSWSAETARDDATPVEDRDLVPVLAAVLDGLRSERPVTVHVEDEPLAARLMQHAFARLPQSWTTDRTFSTFETGAVRPSLRIVCRLQGWDDETGVSSSRGSGVAIDVDLVSGRPAAGLDADVLRWAQALVAHGTVHPWRDGHVPGNVSSLGALLDSIDRSRTAAHTLSADEIVTLGDSTELGEWAGRIGARHAAVRALREASPRQVADLLSTAQREPDAGTVLLDAAWECVEADDEGSTGVANAETVLTALGVPSEEIDLARVRHLPTRVGLQSGAFDSATSQRVLRVLLRQPGGLGAEDWPILARVTWTRRLRTELPTAWLGTVLRTATYRGPVMSDDEADRLTPAVVTRAITDAVAAGIDAEVVGHRLARVLPPGRTQRARVLELASGVPDVGMTAVFLGALAGTQTTDVDRAALLSSRWSDFVDEAGLPGYLADAMVPRRVRRGVPLTRRGVIVLVLVLVVVVAAVVLGVLALR